MQTERDRWVRLRWYELKILVLEEAHEHDGLKLSEEGANSFLLLGVHYPLIRNKRHQYSDQE